MVTLLTECKRYLSILMASSDFKTKDIKHFSVIILGAGPAGSTCAIQLLQLGIKNVLLVESSEFEKFRIGESIPPNANPILQKLGIFEDFLKAKHQPCYGSVSIWGSDLRGHNDFMLNPYGYGWHLDRTKFDAFLTQKAVELGATFLPNTTFQQSKKIGNQFELQFKSNNASNFTLSTDLVVDASGKRCVFAQEQGSQKQTTLPLISLGVRFKLKNTPKVISKLTHLEATKNGWWYAAQIPNNQLLIGFYTDAETAKQYQLNTLENWQKELDTARLIKKLTPDFTPIDAKPKGFAAPSYILNQLSGENWLAIGDAASAYDPITAQGIMKAIQQAMFAAEQITKKRNGEISDFSIFNQYVQQQFGNYLNMRTRFYLKETRWVDQPFWKKLREERVEILI